MILINNKIAQFKFFTQFRIIKILIQYRNDFINKNNFVDIDVF